MTVSAPRTTRLGRCGWIPTRHVGDKRGGPLSLYGEPLCRWAGALSQHRLAQPDAYRHRPVAAYWRSHHGAGPFRRGPGVRGLFDGTSLGDWTMSTISNQPGRDDPGISWYAAARLKPHRNRPRPALAHAADACALRLRLQWMMTAPDDNSGISSFPDPTSKATTTPPMSASTSALRSRSTSSRGPTTHPSTAPARFTGSRGPPPPSTRTGRRVERLRDHSRWARHHGGAERPGGEPVPLHR